MLCISQLRVIHDSGEEGMVLSAVCEKQNIPNKNRVYAMKVLTNYFQTQTQTQVQCDKETFRLLSDCCTLVSIAGSSSVSE